MFVYEESQLENQIVPFAPFRDFMSELGFVVGGSWDYDHGYFDRKLEDDPGYLFVRIPVMVEEGNFGEDEATLRIGAPLLLRHKYQRGLDNYVFVDNSNATFNQFSEPEDPDASLKEGDIEQGQKVIQEVEQAFGQEFHHH
ncbi:YugN family protein [Caldalkalibacillus mannanilyticus]|uniref:YugN family protein n=1 Tax=Caldalkalibacillus mannanilyticus TaxID=1418 RepID=UPI00046A377E|nr:YugN family protein [Caldalkalibacillus mannanilyticus]